MKTLIATLVLAVAAPAAAGPDFVTPSPRPRPLAASTGDRPLAPQDDILFGVDSHALSDVARRQLASAAAWLARNPGHRLVLEGYTDGSGTRSHNEELATRRAAAARAHLVGLGVPSDRLVLVVYGEVAARAARDPLARRVVLYATELAPRAIAIASIDRKRALGAVWVDRGAQLSLERGPRPVLVGER